MRDSEELGSEENEEKQPSQEAPDGEMPEGSEEELTPYERRRQAEREEWRRKAQAQERADEALEQEREEYAKTLEEGKIALIQLKQGVRSEDDEYFAPKDETKHYTFRQKVGNWFYHAWWWLVIAVFIVGVAGFLIYDAVTAPRPDMGIMTLSDQTVLTVEADKIITWAEQFCPDVNENDEQLIQSVIIPVSEKNMEENGNGPATYQSQLLMEFQSAMCMLVITDEPAEAYLTPKEMFVDLEALYPDCAFVDGFRLRLDKTDFAEQVGLSEPLSEGTYMALRVAADNMASLEEMQEAQDVAKTELDGIVAALSEGGAQDAS